MDDPKNKPRRKRKKETKRERAERYHREDAEAKALGISYGKYQAMKSAGTLPKDIQLPEPQKLQKILKTTNLSRKEIAKIDREIMRAGALADQQEAAEMMETVRKGEFYAERYLRMMRKQMEAVQQKKTPAIPRSPDGRR